ncbi:MAG: P-II family nitrogen regulator [Candidatus Freyarchaeum deiterrae]
MKKIEAIIRPEKLNDVKDALAEAGFAGLTVTNVRGRGRQKGLEFDVRGRKMRVDLLNKVKIEVVCKDKQEDKVISTIIESARTGEIGDGMIFVSIIEDVIRVRTGEKGEKAISGEKEKAEKEK